MPRPETLTERVVRRIRRLVPPPAFRLVRERCRGRGIEVGGPSSIFRRGNLWPLYPTVGGLDSFNYASRTLWSQRGGARLVDYDHEFIGEAAEMREIDSGAYDFLLASHVLEHVANPLKALRTWARVVRPGGFTLLIVPHRDGTFDHKRPLTTLAHIIRDFDGNVTEGDDTHLQEIINLHDLEMDPGAGSRRAFIDRATKNLEYRSLHHHVFDTELVLRLVDNIGMMIHYVDVERPYHVCVGYSTPSIATPPNVDSVPTEGNNALWSPFAAWRIKSPFPSDRVPHEA